MPKEVSDVSGLTAMARELIKTRTLRKEHERSAKMHKAEEHLAERALIREMELSGVDGLTIDGRSIRRECSYWAFPISGRKEEAVQALVRHGYEDFVTRPAPNASRLRSLAKEFSTEGSGPPPWFTATFKTEIRHHIRGV